jgi:hypothetical protein
LQQPNATLVRAEVDMCRDAAGSARGSSRPWYARTRPWRSLLNGQVVRHSYMNTETVTIEYPEPIYSLFDTSRDDLPAVVVVNAALREFEHRDVFPWHLSVVVEALELANRGMPTRDEYLLLDSVGDLIDNTVLETRNAIFLARVTWNGRRQLLYRVNNPEVAAQALQDLISIGGQKREWEFRMEGDAEWALATPYLALFENATTEDDA